MCIIIYRNGTITGIVIAKKKKKKKKKKNAINVPSDCTTVFDRRIVLGGNQRYVSELDKVNTMTYS